MYNAEQASHIFKESKEQLHKDVYMCVCRGVDLDWWISVPLITFILTQPFSAAHVIFFHILSVR